MKELRKARKGLKKYGKIWENQKKPGKARKSGKSSAWKEKGHRRFKKV